MGWVGVFNQAAHHFEQVAPRKAIERLDLDIDTFPRYL
jgi:hypothetical protein